MSDFIKLAEFLESFEEFTNEKNTYEKEREKLKQAAKLIADYAVALQPRNISTQQEQFEADYLAAFDFDAGDLAFTKKPCGDYVISSYQIAFEVWLQQAKRHEEELRAKAEVRAASPDILSLTKQLCVVRNKLGRAGLDVMATCVDMAISELLKPAQAVGVPEGWKLVPVEPTISWVKNMREISVYSDKACEGLIRIVLAAGPSPESPT